MEQVTLDSFANMDVCVVKEREAYSLVEEALRETLSKDNLSPDSVFFREGDSQKSQFSSIYLFSENNLLCRICFRGKQNYISVPAQYKDMIPEEYEYRVLASDPGVCRITLNTTQDAEGLTDVLCDIVEAQTDAYPADFGCCSRYEACSDACRCIHPDPNMAIRCIYRKNLKKGRIFYGKNKVERSIATQLKNACSMDSLTFFDYLIKIEQSWKAYAEHKGYKDEEVFFSLYKSISECAIAAHREDNVPPQYQQDFFEIYMSYQDKMDEIAGANYTLRQNDE